QNHAPHTHPFQQKPPARTLKNASMSASVPTSPSALKSAVPQVSQQLPPRHAKNASMSASVPTSPSLLKSALPQGGGGGGSAESGTASGARSMPMRVSVPLGTTV